jgi:hypothetical protein
MIKTFDFENTRIWSCHCTGTRADVDPSEFMNDLKSAAADALKTACGEALTPDLATRGPCTTISSTGLSFSASYAVTLKWSQSLWALTGYLGSVLFDEQSLRID